MSSSAYILLGAIVALPTLIFDDETLRNQFKSPPATKCLVREIPIQKEMPDSPTVSKKLYVNDNGFTAIHSDKAYNGRNVPCVKKARILINVFNTI